MDLHWVYSGDVGGFRYCERCYHQDYAIEAEARRWKRRNGRSRRFSGWKVLDLRSRYSLGLVMIGITGGRLRYAFRSESL
jgi:hypothetical protein